MPENLPPNEGCSILSLPFLPVDCLADLSVALNTSKHQQNQITQHVEPANLQKTIGKQPKTNTGAASIFLDRILIVWVPMFISVATTSTTPRWRSSSNSKITERNPWLFSHQGLLRNEVRLKISYPSLVEAPNMNLGRHRIWTRRRSMEIHPQLKSSSRKIKTTWWQQWLVVWWSNMW